MDKGRRSFTETVRYLFGPSVLKRNLLVALVVGCLLSLTNQFDVIFREPFSVRLGIKIFFNFLIPFTVSSVSAAINRERQ